jgi:RimJ/RimL family protein N-acetyltransferase
MMSSTGNSKPGVQLREVEAADLEFFFQFQLDPDANHMAAFTSKDPADREAFNRHWEMIVADRQIPIRTILYQGQVAGSVLSYVMEGERLVSYWLGKEFWGLGIATRALSRYLKIIAERPIYARAASDNLASIRVLEKNDFQYLRTERGFANARSQEIEEFVFRVD